MSCILYLLTSFLCFVHVVYCQYVYVSLQAPTTVVYQQDKIQFTCSATNVGSTDSISDIILQRNSTFGWQDIVKVYTDTSSGSLQQKYTWTDTNMQGRATLITAITSPTNNAGLKIEISDKNVACSDDATYRCSISGNRGLPNIGKLDSQSTPVHVALKVEANSIDSIQVRPLLQNNTYYPGTVVTMTCSGEVGNPAGHLRWCIKREPLDNTFIGYPNSVDFIEGPPTLNGCQYRRSSVLTYNVTSSYTEVEFRCETGPTATCGLSTTIAANFTLTRLTESPNTGSQTNNSFTESPNTGSQTNNSSSPGAVVGVVLGSITAIIAIVLIVIWMRKQGLLIYRRKAVLERRQTPTSFKGVSSKENNEKAIVVSELGRTVNERSYESLGAKSIPNVYEQLTQEHEINPSYQTLGEKEKPNVYAQLTNESEIIPTYQTLGEKEKPNAYDYLSNKPVLDNDEYVNVNI